MFDKLKKKIGKIVKNGCGPITAIRGTVVFISWLGFIS
jgi:hypothetical protein